MWYSRQVCLPSTAARPQSQNQRSNFRAQLFNRRRGCSRGSRDSCRCSSSPSHAHTDGRNCAYHWCGLFAKMGSQHAARDSQKRNAASITRHQQWSNSTVRPRTPDSSTNWCPLLIRPLCRIRPQGIRPQGTSAVMRRRNYTRGPAGQISVRCVIPDHHVVCKAASDSGVVLPLHADSDCVPLRGSRLVPVGHPGRTTRNA